MDSVDGIILFILLICCVGFYKLGHVHGEYIGIMETKVHWKNAYIELSKDKFECQKDLNRFDQ